MIDTEAEPTEPTELAETPEVTATASPRARMSMRAWETQTAAVRRAAEQDEKRD